jgi:ABC-2 type transport system ATP-binding protein
MIELININKSLGGKRILSNVSLSVRGGEIVGIAGSVGAGKSTLLHILTGLLEPDSGEITLMGLPLKTSRQHIASNINYASSSQRLGGYASVRENLTTYADLYGTIKFRSVVTKLWRFCRIPESLLFKKIFRLSSGENSFVNFTKALLNNPRILFLDEITAHMDPLLTQRVLTVIRKRKKSNNVSMLISQNIDEIRHICTRMIILRQGKIVYDGKPIQNNKINTYYA